MQERPKKIGLVVKEHPTPLEKARELTTWFEERGLEVVVRRTSPPRPDVLESSEGNAPGDLDCIMVLGGDGTFLYAARWIHDQPIPMLGVKFGTVGFLAETTQDSLYEVAQALVDGNFTIEKRRRLAVSVRDNGREVTRQLVLNDAVINIVALARLADMRTHVDDHYLTTFRADGLIVATPTGSTAYSLAAGGPVIHPSVEALIITPICPYTLTNRPLIVPDTAHITIELERKSSDAMLTFDGQAGLTITDRHTVHLTRAHKPVHLIKAPGQNYFDVLKTKLAWSGGKG
ncbi:MAG: NAD(+)/NADH kinase [Desulfatibacillaceae bacterium]